MRVYIYTKLAFQELNIATTTLVSTLLAITSARVSSTFILRSLAQSEDSAKPRTTAGSLRRQRRRLRRIFLGIGGPEGGTQCALVRLLLGVRAEALG
jgi:NhaP-type Na+/H+ or K+/H+ antiporter